MLPFDSDYCYDVVRSRDRRFDGWFITAVRTTGIYCRPSCPALTPKRCNVVFFPSAAAAHQQGFRSCKRCHPDASPGSPEWNYRSDVTARAMRLISDGVVERKGVAGLAAELGYSQRHLNRLITEELGVGPKGIARARRAELARSLVETTGMPLTEVAFAAGFGSVRQFNETVQNVYGTTPSALRKACKSEAPTAGMNLTAKAVRLKLPTRLPFDGPSTLGFLGARAVAGVEWWDGSVYRRSLSLPGGHGTVALTAVEDHVVAEVVVTAWADLATAVQRVRRMLDMDADPEAVTAALSNDSTLRPLVEQTPGRRSIATVDPFETAIRVVVGQQVSVAGARTVIGRIVSAVGSPLAHSDDNLTHVFPSPAELVDADDEIFSMPKSRRDTVRRLAAAVVEGSVRLTPGADPNIARQELLSLKGVGPWTADVIIMRGLGHPDVFLSTDLGIKAALKQQGRTAAEAEGWAPWRSYAVHYLWASLHTKGTDV